MRLQRIPIDGGFTCPNRDGTKGIGGCTFCNSEAFAPSYCRTHASITEQIEAGKRFFAEKYRGEVKYLAYFQSFSGTYAPVETLRQRYEEALSADDVVGLVIATRPDCINEEVLEPSVCNEVRHALAVAPTNAPAATALPVATNGQNRTQVAIRLVSAQKADGRWLVGTNDVTSAAVELLKELLK